MTHEQALIEGMVIVAGVLFCFWMPVTIFELAKKWMR
jgi:hypothetical protein